MQHVMMSLIKDSKAMYGINIKYDRYHNDGESEDFKRVCKQEGICIQFKYSAPGTPQQNCRVERKFASL